MLVIKGRVIDGNGGPPLEKGLVAIEGERIIAVCNQWEYKIPDAAQVIEIRDGTVMPGLIDMHVHLGLKGNFFTVYTTHVYEAICTVINDMRKILNAGFTSMRECGGPSNFLKQAWENGTIEGPRIFSAGKCVVQTGGHFDFIKQFPVEYTEHHDRNITSIVADGVDEARKVARLQFREGADFIKLMLTPGNVSQSMKYHVQEFSDQEIRVFVEEAEKYGTYVAAHTHANAGIKAALRCGVKCLEHCTYAQEEDLELMVKQGNWYVPTLSTSYRFMHNLEKAMPWVQEKMPASFERRTKFARMAHDAGVVMGCGADFGGDEICPHGLNGLELELLVKIAGFTPMEAIMAATKVNAMMILRGHELGTLEQGKLADVIVVEGNPLEDIHLLTGPKNVHVVIQGGKIKKYLPEVTL